MRPAVLLVLFLQERSHSCYGRELGFKPGSLTLAPVHLTTRKPQLLLLVLFVGAGGQEGGRIKNQQKTH